MSSKSKTKEKAHEKDAIEAELKKNATHSVITQADGINLEETAGAGSENITSANLAVPIIRILQANSPQCKPMDPKYIKGAVEGSFFNNVTNEVYSGEEGIIVLPVFFEKVFIEWRPNRGGFVAIHGEDTPLRTQVKMLKENPNDPSSRERPTLPSGNILAETDQHYVLMLVGGGFEPAVISMSSTALRSSRQWNTLVNRVLEKDKKGQFYNPARWFVRYKLVTKGRQKDQNTWATWDIIAQGKLKVTPTSWDAIQGKFIEQTVDPQDVSLFRAAQALHAAVKGGKVAAKIEEDDETPGGIPASAGLDAEVDLG